MKYLTYEQFCKRADDSNDYWKNGKYRWEYMSAAIYQLELMKARKVIEAGASGMPLCDRSYLFDLPVHDLNEVPYLHDGKKIPDKFYDCFVALQVWEHIDNRKEAFLEVKRIAKHALLSFPYMWPKGDERHVNIGMDTISAWTCGIPFASKMLIGTRLLIRWDFE